MNEDIQNIEKEKNGINILEDLYLFFSKAFKYFNKKVFDNILPNVSLLLQNQKPRGRLFGFFRNNMFKINKVWTPMITIIIDEIKDTDIKKPLETLIHEMVHFEAKVRMIQDTTKSGFHNNNFKKIAESRGYIIETKDKRHGWNTGKADEQLLEIIKDFLINNPFPFSSFETYKEEKEKKERTIFNYVCLGCGVVIKGKKDIDVICGICNEQFEIVLPKPNLVEEITDYINKKF